jgi:hypothetical protein
MRSECEALALSVLRSQAWCRPKLAVCRLRYNGEEDW